VIWFQVVVLALAAFRLSRLFIEDTIFQPVRTAIFSRWPGQDVEYDAGDKVRGGTFSQNGKLYASEPTWTGDRIAMLLGCYACTGFWVSLILSVLWWLWPNTIWVVFPLALSSVVWFLALIQERLD
jgi:hypothetical protein